MRPRPITLDTDAIEARVRDALAIAEATHQVSDDPAENAPARDVAVAKAAYDSALRLCARLFLNVNTFEFNRIAAQRLRDREAQWQADVATRNARIAS